MTELIRILNVQVDNNPTNIMNPFSFQVFFEVMENLPYETEWEIIYIGAAGDPRYDQVLEKFNTVGKIRIL